MNVVISTIGTFHSFDLARQLHEREALAGIYSGYPRFKLARESLPRRLVHTFPWLHAPYMAFPHRERLGVRLVQAWEHLDHLAFDAWVSRKLGECDVFVGLSGSALRSGRAAKDRGIGYVCDRGCSHIRVQDELVREEHERWGVPYAGTDPRVIEWEEAEYREADRITVPSSFSMRTFLAQGTPPAKLRLLPYGVDLSRFTPTDTAVLGRFDVLFVGAMSLRKGVPYLLEAYRQLQHPTKSITFAGATSPSLIALMRQRGLWPEEVRVLGHVPQAQLKHLMSRSHVLVLPSIEDGFGLVMAQAMACGCVVIASRNTGAEDLFAEGTEGLVVPIRDAESIAAQMQRLADQPDLRAAMSRRGLERVRSVGGWRAYGERSLAIYGELAA